jgi:hypothetical protein
VPPPPPPKPYSAGVAPVMNEMNEYLCTNLLSSLSWNPPRRSRPSYVRRGSGSNWSSSREEDENRGKYSGWLKEQWKWRIVMSHSRNRLIQDTMDRSLCPPVGDPPIWHSGIPCLSHVSRATHSCSCPRDFMSWDSPDSAHFAIFVTYCSCFSHQKTCVSAGP